MDERLQYKAALALAKRTLDFVADYGTPPTPHAYELFYTVAAGLKPEVNAAVADVVADKQRVSGLDAERLYQSFLASDANSDKVDEIGKRLSRELAHTLRALGVAARNTREYEDSLGLAEQQLSASSDDGGAGSILRSLIAATRQMAETNRSLTENLEASQAQVTELEECLKLVREETSKDALTGLTNRRRFDMVLNDAIQEASESGTPLSLLMADIDNFKPFNDTYGHLAGDAVLKYVAGCMRSIVKGQDEVARYGGEEFAIVLPDTSGENAAKVAEKIRSAVTNRELVKKSSGKSLGKVSVSIGVAEYQPPECAEAFVHRADSCLYAAKAAGRNRVCSEPIDMETETDPQSPEPEQEKDAAAVA